MAILIHCQNCGKRLQTQDANAGKRLKCPACSSVISVPIGGSHASTPPMLDTSDHSQKRARGRILAIFTVAACAVTVAIVGWMVSKQNTTSQERESVGSSTAKTKDGIAAKLDGKRDKNPPTRNDQIAKKGTQEQPEASRNPKVSLTGTGIKEKILVAAVNANGNLQRRYHHNFQLVNTTTLDKNRVAVFKDKNSPLTLLAVGAADDLVAVQLRMSVDDFIGEKDGKVTGDGAAAFGRCVQRMAFAADPSWSGDLYKWMNQEMARALITPKGVSTTRKNLIAKFGTFTNDEKKMFVTMTIGALDK